MDDIIEKNEISMIYLRSSSNAVLFATRKTDTEVPTNNKLIHRLMILGFVARFS